MPQRNKKPAARAKKKASREKETKPRGGRAQKWIYALNPMQIEVNDVVLLSRAGLTSWAIRNRTHSDFSHAALCTRDGMLIEAMPQGVMHRSVIGTYATRPEWIKVLRTKIPLGLSAEAQPLTFYAERLYGRAYSKIRAGTSIIGWIDIPDDGSTFCSRVIAEAFCDFGMDILPGTKLSKITPAMLLKSRELKDVTRQCIRKLGSETDRHLFDEVVETASQQSPGDEMEMNRRVFDSIVNIRWRPHSDLAEQVGLSI